MMIFWFYRLISKVGDERKVILMPPPPSNPEAWKKGGKNKSVDM